jgi:hypothetical protein
MKCLRRTRSWGTIYDRGSRVTFTGKELPGRRAGRGREAWRELFGVEMVELLENRRGLLPHGTRSVGVTCGVVAVAKVGKDIGLAIPVLDLPGQVDGFPVAANGLSMLTQLMVGIAEAVPGIGLPDAGTKLLLQGESPLAQTGASR